MCAVTIKLGEVVYEVRVHDFLLQQVFLVEEEDDRGVLEPGICDDGPEESFALLHAVLTKTKNRHDKPHLFKTRHTNKHNTKSAFYSV